MAPDSTKKRKAPKIDKFFKATPSPPTASTSTAPARSATLKRDSPVKKRPKTVKRVVKRKKIIDLTPIQIDSDDSDVEILEQPSKLPRVESSVADDDVKMSSKAKGKQKALDQDVKMDLDKPTKPKEADTTAQGQVEMNGQGGHLEEQPNEVQEDEPVIIEGVETGTPFGDSSRSEHEQEDDSAELDLTADDPPPEGQDPLFRMETPNENEEAMLEDEWGEEPPMEVASDDDGEYEVPPVGEDDVVVQGSSKDLEDPAKDEAACPVCAVVLSSLPESERQAHVNICLDGPDAAKGTSGGFFAPISSLFRSRPSPAPPSSSVKGKSVAMEKKPSIDKKPIIDKKPLVDKKPSLGNPLKSLSALNPFGAATTSGKPNAFTALMTGHVENKQWIEAEAADKRKGRVKMGEQKAVPFYKWVEGLEITVDAFRYNRIDGCKGYFLSHAHSDHYQNLSSSWTHGPIYCSLTTANLIKLKLKVKDEYLKVLPMNETVNVQGIDVTLIDANHCPGSVIFLFEGPHTDPKSPYSKNPKRIFRYLHCGDFRASPAHILHPSMIGKRMDAVYLDTTYLDAKYCFPAQELVVAACSQLVRERVLDGDEEALSRTEGEEQERARHVMKGWLREGKAKKEEEDAEAERLLLEMGGAGEEGGEGGALAMEGDGEEKPDIKPKKERRKEKLLVLVGTYSIGKERIVKGIAHALETKIYCDDKKLSILQAQDDPELHALITRDPLEAQVHVCWLQDIKHDALADYLGKYSAGRMEGGFTKLIGLRPTGWTYRGEGKSGEKVPSIAKILEREKLRKFSPAGMYPQRDSTSTCLAYGVPYSEHSSFYELTCFALSLDYGKMIPTVNVHTASSRDKMKDWMTRWMAEKKRRQQAKIPPMVPHRSDTYW